MGSIAPKTPPGAKCYLRILPPELRRFIFNHTATDAFNDNKSPIRACIYYNDELCSLKRLLDRSLKATVHDVKWGLTKLEAVLFHSDKDLYPECLHVRLAHSTLCLDSGKEICPRKRTISHRFYPIFGIDLPVSIVQGVKSVYYVKPGYVLDPIMQ